jgi:hypothetical protein
MSRIIRDIDPDSARDLLERVPRACISFACEHGPQVEPVMLVWHEGRYLVGLPLELERQPGVDQEVVLLVDEGIFFFDLRAIYIRGRIGQAQVPRGAPAGHIWFEVVPFKTVAWDYATLREVEDEQ